METRMSLSDPLQGHFEYTEHFHMPWLWNGLITNILVMGLGGGSTQRSYARYCPEVTVETVEIDPTVLQVATNFFILRKAPGRSFTSRTGEFFSGARTKSTGILMDAHAQNRYGGAVPIISRRKSFYAGRGASDDERRAVLQRDRHIAIVARRSGGRHLQNAEGSFPAGLLVSFKAVAQCGAACDQVTAAS